MKKIASIISIILHPLIVTPIVFTILIYHDKLTVGDNISFIVSITFTTILPFITFLFLKKLKLISDYNVSIRKERVFPLYLNSLYFLLGYLILYLLNADLIIQGLMFCYTVNTFLVAIITKIWKISLHAISISGPLTALWLDDFKFPLIMATLIILVSISRLILNAHTISQVIAGTLFAIIFTYFELYLLFL